MATKKKSTHGGKRPNSGRKAAETPQSNHTIRCTDAGWEWLKSQAAAAGKSSVGKWADSHTKTG